MAGQARRPVLARPRRRPGLPDGWGLQRRRDVWVQASYPDQGDLRTWQFSSRTRRTATPGCSSRSPASTARRSSPTATVTRSTSTISSGVALRRPTRATAASTSTQATRGSAPVLPTTSTSSHRASISAAPTTGSSVATRRPERRAVLGLGVRRRRRADATASINVYGRCIDRRVLADSGHRHAIAMAHLPGLPFASWAELPTPPVPQRVPVPVRPGLPQFHNYKAMVGWFWMGAHWEHNWFIGMEPRPQTAGLHLHEQGPQPGPGEVRHAVHQRQDVEPGLTDPDRDLTEPARTPGGLGRITSGFPIRAGSTVWSVEADHRESRHERLTPGLPWKCHPPHVLGDRMNQDLGLRDARLEAVVKPPGSRSALVGAAAARHSSCRPLLCSPEPRPPQRARHVRTRWRCTRSRRRPR